MSKKKRNLKSAIVFIVDGQTELWYLQMMRDVEKIKGVSILPKLPKRKKIKDVYNTVIDYAKYYDKVFWIVDLDTIIREDKDKKKGKESPLIFLGKCLKDLENKCNVEVIINTPCLEFWFLLHIHNTSKYYYQCNNVCKQFKHTILNEYEKKEKYYKNSVNIYSKLKPFLDTAILRSSNLGNYDIHNPETAKTEMYKLFRFLGIN